MKEGLPQAFLVRLAALPEGAGRGRHGGRTWGVTVNRSADGRRVWLYGEEQGGTDKVSFNLYLTSTGQPILKPCEMPDEKVIDFVLAYEPETSSPVQLTE